MPGEQERIRTHEFEQERIRMPRRPVITRNAKQAGAQQGDARAGDDSTPLEHQRTYWETSPSPLKAEQEGGEGSFDSAG